MKTNSPLFRWSALSLASAVLMGSLTACAPLLVGGTFFGTVKVATDRRTTETQLVDEAIELRAFNRLRETLVDRGRVSAASFGRRVLLVGEVPSAEDKALAERAVSSIDNVLRVINELQVSPAVPLNQRSEDVIITGRIRAQILDARDLTSNAFKITVNRGVVYIMGIVTDREADRVTNMARNTPGVKQVVNMVDLITEAELARIQIGQQRAPANPAVPSGNAVPSSAPPSGPSSGPPSALPAPATNIAPGQPL
jgi:osmotically-inducible protein OsmY